MMPDRRLAAAVPALLACALWACGGKEAPTETRPSFAGTYRLASINGQSPDTSVRDFSLDAAHPSTLQFTGEVLILRPDSTVADEQSVRQVPARPAPCTTTSHQEGTWHAEGARIAIDMVKPARSTDCWTYDEYHYVGTVRTDGALSLQQQAGMTLGTDVRVFTRVP